MHTAIKERKKCKNIYKTRNIIKYKLNVPEQKRKKNNFFSSSASAHNMRTYVMYEKFHCIWTMYITCGNKVLLRNTGIRTD